MYNIDYNKFLESLEKMPENNFINCKTDAASEHFYQTSSEIKRGTLESNKIINDEDAYKKNIDAVIHENRENPNNINNTNAKLISPENREEKDNNKNDDDDDDLSKLFDF